MLKAVSEWAEAFRPEQKPWLVLGKGPSYAAIETVRRDNYHHCTLNHVIREQKAALAHAIDVSVIVECADFLESQADFVAMPWHPHVEHSVSTDTLIDFVRDIPVLRRLTDAGRLLCYNLSSAWHLPGFPGGLDISAKYFSAEAAVGLLAACGVTEIRTLGVDGGTSYASAFEDLTEKTLLSNGHRSFDCQFEGIREVVSKSEIVFGPANVDVPVKIYVGCDRSQLLALKALEYSIRKHARVSVEIVAIDNGDLPSPRDDRNAARTGFSFSRFKIPGLNGFRGRALYLDADMLVFDDILDLWSRDFDGASLLYADWTQDGARKPQFSVLLMDCAELPWNAREIVGGLDAGRYDYKQLMHGFCILPAERKRAALPQSWNSLEHYEAGVTKLLHYTDMPTQPWVSRDNPHGDLWYACLNEALDGGAIDETLLHAEIRHGHVSPDLPEWLGRSAPQRLAQGKAEWVAPYRKFSRVEAEPTRAEGPLRGMLSRIRHALNV